MIEFSVLDVLTEEELDKAGELYAETSPEDFMRRCLEEVVRPALPRLEGMLDGPDDAVALADKVRRTFAYVMGPGGFVARMQ